MELLPEKCGSPQNKDFDAVLAQVWLLFLLIKHVFIFILFFLIGG